MELTIEKLPLDEKTSIRIIIPGAIIMIFLVFRYGAELSTFFFLQYGEGLLPFPFPILFAISVLFVISMVVSFNFFLYAYTLFFTLKLFGISNCGQ